MINSSLQHAIQCVPARAWAVGVSGGADSVALLSLLRTRSDLSLHIVHLDHQTRGAASTGDARFVEELAGQWRLPCTIARRDQIEPGLPDPPANTSALYRAVRLALFRKVAIQHGLAGVILAHHADDQAETVFQRLLRGSGYAGLAGMSFRTDLNGLTILRPLLGVSRATLREHLTQSGIGWREDASNESSDYLRNRLRKVLTAHPELSRELRLLAGACGDLRNWVRSAAPVLPEQVPVGQLVTEARLLAEESAKRWLVEVARLPADELSPAVIDRLLTMAGDAATPARQQFPAGVIVRRRRGVISASIK